MPIVGGVSGSLSKLVIGSLASARVLPADALVQAGIPRRPGRSLRRSPSGNQPCLFASMVLSQCDSHA